MPNVNDFGAFGLAALNTYRKMDDYNTQKQERAEDRSYQNEQRARQRKAWERTDKADAAFAEGYGSDASAAPGLDATQSSTQPTGETGATASAGLGQARTAPNMQSHAKRVLKGLESRMNAAAQSGDMDTFVSTFDKAASVRTIVRNKLRDDADREFAVRGGEDFSPYIGIYNDWLDNDTKINAIQKGEDGQYRVQGTDAKGQPFEQVIGDKQKMHGFVEAIFNPQATRAAEAGRKEKVWESSLKVTEQGQIDDRKSKNDMAVETYKAGLKPPEVVKASGGEGKPDRVGMVKGGRVEWQDDGQGGGAASPLDGKTTDRLRTTIMGLYKVSDMETMNPAIRQKVGNALTFGSQILQSNQGTEAGQRLDINTAAKIASDLADGTLTPTNFKDKSGRTWRGVDVGGVKYLLDPAPAGGGQVSPTGAGSREVRGTIRQQTGGPEWQVDPQAQASRDASAGKLIAGEYGSVEAAQAGLAELNKSIVQAKEPTARKILEGERDRLQSGLNSLNGSAPPVAAQGKASPKALAYLEAHPESAPQFKQKYGYLPKGF